MTYRIGTRGSDLALIQARFVRDRLAAAYPDDTFELVVISTRGDRDTKRPLAALGGSGVFVREIEAALLAAEIDLAVHSMKDLPAEQPAGLCLAKAWTRADARDVLVVKGPDGAPVVAAAGTEPLDLLPKGSVVATGSVRRALFLGRRRPDLTLVDIRGNVDTRLRKLFAPHDDEPRLDALVLAAAGLLRLGRTDVISAYLDPTWMIPAPHQGQLAIEVRAADTVLRAKADALGDDLSEAVVQAEHAFLRATGATCRDAVAAYARFENGVLEMERFYEPVR